EENESMSDSRSHKRSFENQLSVRVYEFLTERSSQKWKSWYYDNSRVHNDLLELNERKEILKLTLTSCGIRSLDTLKELNNLNELDLTANRLNNLGELSYFSSLKKLNLRYNDLKNLKGIENINQVEYLDITGNPINNYSPLYN